MAVKKRCGFCRKVLREDGTCSNEACPRYVPQPMEQEEDKADKEDKEEA